MMKNATMSTFTSVINPTKRLSSGSACERCRTRKTKCDGGQPCAFCFSHKVPCIHRPTNSMFNTSNRKKKSKNQRQTKSPNNRYFDTVISPNDTLTNKNHSPDVLLLTNDQQQQQQEKVIRENATTNHHLPIHWKRMPSIMDQLSCHTFTIEAAYSSCKQ